MKLTRIIYLLVASCFALHIPLVGEMVYHADLTWGSYVELGSGLMLGATIDSANHLVHFSCVAEITAIIEYAYMSYIYVHEYV